MNLAKISVQNIRHKALSSFLSILLLSFGTGIIVLLLSASEKIDQQFTRNIRGIDMVVGAKGSPLQLVLSSVYHIDAPTGNIKLSEFEKLKKHPMVAEAIPLSYGDNYQGFRIVGTDTSYPRRYEATLEKGRWWQERGEVVIGSAVSAADPLQVGQTFHGSHGVSQSLEQHEDFDYKVVGKLEPTGTVIDKLILTSTESVWAVHEHEDHAAEGHSHEEDREITAGLVSFRSPMGNLMVPRMVNETTNMQAALPAIEYNRLYSLMSGGVATLQALAVLIVLISAISVFISLYQPLRERRYELALMRSMGAGSFQLFYIVLLEGLIISVAGYLIGLFLGKFGLAMLSMLVSDTYQYQLGVELITREELLLLPAVLIIGFLAALLPAVRAYRLNISKILADA